MLKRNSKQRKKAQVIIEFTFSMIIVMLMMFSLIKIFGWTGIDLVERRIGHDTTLRQAVNAPDYTSATIGDGPLGQIDPYFYQPVKMNAIWRGF